MGKKTILDVRVKDVEKRRYPTKHYAYVLEVSWSEGSSTTVYRRYSDFFEFQCFLLEKFPLEAGAKDPAQRMIPFLPGKKLFGRSNTRAVAEKRREKIDEYCRTLIRLPPHISDCEFVMEFYEIRQTDLEKPQKPKLVKGQPKISEISGPLILERYVAIADYEKQKKNECTVQAGQTVEVIDKNENGWWFVNVDDFHEGWVPATYLEPLYGSEDVSIQRLDTGEEETWISTNKYEAGHHDELTFEKGVLVEVFEKGIDGWFKIRYNGQEGMAPAAYLKRYHGDGKAGQATSGAQVVSTLSDVNDTATQSSTSSSTSSSSTIKPKPPNANLRSATISSPTTSPTLCSEEMTENISYNTDNTADTAAKSSAVASLASSLMTAGKSNSLKPRAQSTVPAPLSPTPSPKPMGRPSQPTPSPKPASAVAAAAAAIAETQKFAPTWHSQAKPHVDEEPIYGPTPRRYSFKKPPLQKRDVSSSSSAFPEPVYEIIPEPEAEVYVTIAQFTATAGDGISFVEGKECTVVTKNSAGWWYVEMDEMEGWVPSSYLERKSTSVSPLSNKSPTSPAFPLPAKKPLHTIRPPLKEAQRDPPKEVRRDPPKEARRDPPKEARRDPPKEARRDPPKEAQRPGPGGVNMKKEPPKPAKRESRAETSPHDHELRKFSLSSRSNDAIDGTTYPRPSLRRSTSTDSGLYEEVGFKNKQANPLHSPPPVRVTAPSRPVRPKVTPTLPNTKSVTSSKSPRGDRKSLKASISSPVPFQPSPDMRRKMDSNRPTPPRGTLDPGKAKGRVGGAYSPAAVKRPPPIKSAEVNSRNVSAGRKGMDHSDSNSRSAMATRKVANHTHTSPEVHAEAGYEAGRRPTAGRRRGSTDNNSGNAYKLELAKKLSEKPGPPPTSTQHPKRPSPPNRPKGPTPAAFGGKHGGTSGRVGPSRPQPAKVVPGKRPPPPRPSAPPPAKKLVYVTIGRYTGGDPSTCLSFEDGEEAEVLEKSDDGWWFVKIGDKEGWAPSTYIEEQQRPVEEATPPNSKSHPSRPKPPPPFAQSGSSSAIPAKTSRKLETSISNEELTDSTPKPKPRPRPRKTTTTFYRAIDSYEVPAYEDSAIALVQGRVYELKEKSEGWWLMKDGDLEGWAPASHFKLA